MELPGRFNNLYKGKFEGTEVSFNDSYIQEVPEPGILCKEAANQCLEKHTAQDNYIPQRKVQLDISVENARDAYKEFEKSYSMLSLQNPTTIIILAILVACIFLNFTPRFK